jgi:hypothetical protein
MSDQRDKRETEGRREKGSRLPPEVFNVVIECRDEGEQREWYERLKEEGVRVRLLVL